MNSFKFIFTFTLGAAVGSVVTWKLVQTKYEKIAEEEIDEIRSFYRNKMSEPTEGEDTASEPTEDLDEALKEYEAAVDEYAVEEKEQKGGSDDVEKPYVISPAEFGEMDGYSVETLFYYANGMLADANGEVIDDAEDIIGEDSLTHFGDYEEDSVCVRNDRLKADYEILKDNGDYEPQSEPIGDE